MLPLSILITLARARFLGVSKLGTRVIHLMFNGVKADERENSHYRYPGLSGEEARTHGSSGEV